MNELNAILGTFGIGAAIGVALGLVILIGVPVWACWRLARGMRGGRR